MLRHNRQETVISMLPTGDHQRETPHKAVLDAHRRQRNAAMGCVAVGFW
jgi:hypothetical protein